MATCIARTVVDVTYPSKVALNMADCKVLMPLLCDIEDPLTAFL